MQPKAGNFQVYLDKNYLRVMFKIRLYVDDLAVLHKIRDFLGVGIVVISGDSCVFIISDVKRFIKCSISINRWVQIIQSGGLSD